VNGTSVQRDANGCFKLTGKVPLSDVVCAAPPTIVAFARATGLVDKDDNVGVALSGKLVAVDGANVFDDVPTALSMTRPRPSLAGRSSCTPSLVSGSSGSGPSGSPSRSAR